MKWLLGLILSTANAWADPVALFKQNFPARSLGPLAEQAFCYEDDNGVKGDYRGQHLQRLASVTKLFTTLIALENISIDKTWTTEFWLKGDRLHIKGGLDPWFEEEKIFGLIADLQKLGVKKISQLSFDSQFVFTDTALSRHTLPSSAMTLEALKRYFNASGKLSPVALQRLKAVKDFQKEEHLSIPLPTSGIVTPLLTHSAQNPLQGQVGVKVLKHQSKPLPVILKAMNAMSKNMVSHLLFEQAGKVRALKDVLLKYKIQPAEYKFHNGSGLPVIQGESRVDNLATCFAILKLLSALEKRALELQVPLDELIAVGSDLGSFKDRFLTDLPLKDAVMAKTGTLKHSSSLAGWIEAPTPVKFAILNHTSATMPARNWQDSFLSRWMNGQALSRGYVRVNIYPVEGPFFNSFSSF